MKELTIYLMNMKQFNYFLWNLSTDIEEKYAFLHGGMVQVTVKALTREAINTSVLLCLRVDRNLRFHDSLLVMMETSLHNGPVYFKFI